MSKAKILEELAKRAESGIDSLAMDFSSRMQRAKEQGFDTDTVYYHGTGAEFDNFDPSYLGGGDSKYGFYFSKRPETADAYRPIEEKIKPEKFKKKWGKSIEDAKNLRDIEYNNLKDAGFNFKESWSGSYKRDFFDKNPDLEDSFKKWKNIEDKLYPYNYDNPRAGLYKSEWIDEELSGRRIEAKLPSNLKEVDMGGESWNEARQSLIAKEALRDGYKGVLFKDMQDSGWFGGVGSDDVALVFDPSNIRSTNAAFDPAKKDSSNLLASAGAGIGALGLMGASDDSEASFIGSVAKTWNKGAEALAKKMADDGASRDEIWQATGQMGAPTFKDVDGKWKQEISDQGFKLKYQDDMAKVKELENNLGKTLREKGFDSQEFKDVRLLTQPLVEALSDPYRGLSSKPIKNLLDNDELFNAYPDMKNIQASYELNDSAIPSASYNPNLDSIKAVGDLDSIKYSTGHELQHAIQEREGFAKGGNPSMFDRDIALYNLEMDALGIKDVIDDIGEGATNKEIKDAYEDFWGESIDENLIPYAQMNPRDLIQKRVDKYYNELKGLPETVDKMSAYRRLAGEAEARNVESRLNYDMNQRIANPPWNTLDVPESELIVRGQKGQATLPNMIGGAGLGLAGLLAMQGEPYTEQTAQAARYPVAGSIADTLGRLETPIGRPFAGLSDYVNKINYGDDIGILDRLGAVPDPYEFSKLLE